MRTPVHDGMVACAYGPHPAPAPGQVAQRREGVSGPPRPALCPAAALPGGRTLGACTLHTQALILNELASLLRPVHLPLI